MDRRLISLGAFFGFTAVILGAFGAHALKQVLDASQVATFETGVRYQMYHAFLMMFIGILPNVSHRRKTWMMWLISIGIVLFSGSIYLLATDPLNDFNFRVIGFVTPIGGLLLIVAWLLLFIDFIGKKS